MKKLTSIFIFIYTIGFAQSTFKHVKTIEINSNFFTADNQGNFYVINGNELIKFDKAGNQLYKYSNKKFGSIDFVDASNQLKLLIYYRNFSQVVFLDNTLSMGGTPPSFDEIGFQQIQLVCSSHNNGVWMYDQQNFSLIRLNQTFEETQRTGNLNNLLNINLQPNYLLEYNNKVYINNPSSGILIFDIYGTYYKTIPIKNLQTFQPIGEWVYYKNEKKIKAYNIKTAEEKEFEVPQSDFDLFCLQMDILFLQTKKAVSVFSGE